MIKLIRYELKKIIVSPYILGLILLLSALIIFLGVKDWTQFGNEKIANQLLSDPDAADEILRLLREEQLRQKTLEIQEIRANIRLSAARYGLEAVKANDLYGIRRNAAIIQSYADVPISINHRIYGIDYFLSFPYGALAAILMTLVANAGLFSEEYRRNTWMFLKSSRDGRGKLFWAKILAGMTASTLFLVIFQGVAFLVILFDQGMGGFSESVLAIDGWSACPLNLTVFQYMLIEAGLKLYAIFLFGLTAASFSAIARNTRLSFLMGALFFALNITVTLLTKNQRSEWMLLQIAQPESLLSVYRDMNLLSFPIPRILMLIFMWTGTVGLLCIAAGKQDRR